MATVLVVDDEPPILALLQDVLEDEGYTVFVASNGRDALSLARSERPDVILSDVMMPLMNGIQLSKSLNAEPATAGAIVILMSAALPPDYVDAGATAFMAKPFTIEQVIGVIAEHVGRSNWQSGCSMPGDV